MRDLLQRFTQITCAAFFVLLSLLPNANTALASGSRIIPVIRDHVFQQLVEVEKLQREDRHLAARDLLESFARQSSLNSYERATLYHKLAYLYYLDNALPVSITHYERVLNERDSPLALRLETLYTLAKLNMQLENYGAAIQRLQAWLELTEQPTEEAYAMLAQAYYRTSHYQLVVDNLLKAVELTEARNNQPDEQWLLMLQQSYVELGLAEKQVAVLKWLMGIYPKRDYILALASTYGILDQSEKQLAMLEIAYARGHLTESAQLLTLASLHFNLGAPLKAAKVLERGITDGIIPDTSQQLTFLASAWMAAREHEKAIPVLRQAARLRQDPHLYRMVGNAHYQLGQWDDAANAFKTAITLDHQEDKGLLWMILGQTYVQAKDFDSAIVAFQQARSSISQRQRAEHWLRYSENEKHRLATFRQTQSSP